MDIYVINLDRSTERLRDFRQINKHFPNIHRFPAVDGSSVNRNDLVEANVFSPNLPYTDGAVGAALSHLFFWKAAVSEKSAITVCEDDAILHSRFEELAQEALVSLGDSWDFVLWGWNFDSILQFDLMPGISPCLGLFNQEQMRKNVELFQESVFRPTLYRLIRAFGIVCYTISPSGARKFLAETSPIRPFSVSFPLVNDAFPNNGIDIVMNDLYPRMDAYVSFPPLVITKNEHAISTVQLTR